MLVRDVGEFELIALLSESLGVAPSACNLRLGIGDDAAAWDAPAATQVFTTDTMVDGVHFIGASTDWWDLGWKAVVVNLSDIAAMGCVPTYSIVTLGLTGDEPVDGLTRMYEGMREVCNRFGGPVVGGDVVRAPVLFVTVAMMGTASAGREATLLTRSAARVGDSIAVTGHLGCSAGGLVLLTGAESPEVDVSRHLLDAHNRPQPRLDEAKALVQHGVKAAMDVSDGLVSDLTKLCVASGVSASLRSGVLPADDHLIAAFPDRYLSLALEGGEDYELLFTAPMDVINRVAQDVAIPITVIGDIREGDPHVVVTDEQGRTIQVSSGGWDHFGREG